MVLRRIRQVCAGLKESSRTLTWASSEPDRSRGPAAEGGPACGATQREVTVFWWFASRASSCPPDSTSHTLPSSQNRRQKDGWCHGFLAALSQSSRRWHNPHPNMYPPRDPNCYKGSYAICSYSQTERTHSSPAISCTHDISARRQQARLLLRAAGAAQKGRGAGHIEQQTKGRERSF